MSLRKWGKSDRNPANGAGTQTGIPVPETDQAAYRRRTALPPLGRKRRRAIISAYVSVLGGCKSSVARESDLPWPKDLIGKAICEEIIETPDDEARTQLRVAYVLLESFLSTEDWNVVEYFKLANTLALEMAQSGSPQDVVASARILRAIRGDRAVGIQERIWEMKKRRMKFLQRIESGT